MAIGMLTRALDRGGIARPLAAALLRLRRPILTASALMLVMTTVLLVLDARLPFPPPSERLLYDPSDWSMLFGGPGGQSQREGNIHAAAPDSIGGFSLVQPPVSFLLYRVKPGDTITGIAQKLAMNPDTISSLNRTEGRGVHNLTVGEKIRIPTQDGIFVALDSDFDALCRKKGVSPEDVLAANGIGRDQLVSGRQLFFPGVQHRLRVQPLPRRGRLESPSPRVGDLHLRLPPGPLHR